MVLGGVASNSLTCWWPNTRIQHHDKSTSRVRSDFVFELQQKLAAVDRAQYFMDSMDWAPDGLKGEDHQKDFTVAGRDFCCFGVSKMEAKMLETTKPGE